MKEIAPRIIVDNKICSGKPVIRGTRVLVEVIVGKVAGGMSISEVAYEYGISEDDVKAALKYAAEVVSSERLIIYE